MNHPHQHPDECPWMPDYWELQELRLAQYPELLYEGCLDDDLQPLFPELT